MIRVENLKVGYKKKAISPLINAYFQSGKLIGIIGKNGIGKSTFIKTITKNLPKISGEIYIEQTHLNQISLETLATKMSVVFSSKPELSNISVYELIALGRHPYTNWIGNLRKEDEFEIKKALQQTELEHLQHKKVHQLSDGQLQKAMIARALAQNTPLIILDEPTTHLDIQNKIKIIKLLKKIAEETQKCILFSTHDIDISIQLCHELMVWTQEKVFHDTPCNLIENKIFDALFDDENIKFDATKGKFIID